MRGGWGFHGLNSGMLTKKGKYGLKALVHLSGLPVGQLAFVNDIAVANNIPKKFLDAILGELRNAGFVQSRKGKEGGYRLARPASEIKIGHVVRVLDGPLAPIPCASRTQYQRCEDCDEATCQVRHMMLEVRQAIAEVLDNAASPPCATPTMTISRSSCRRRFKSRSTDWQVAFISARLRDARRRYQWANRERMDSPLG